jgi:hypothetical protein
MSHSLDEVRLEAANTLGLMAIKEQSYIQNIVEMIHQLGKAQQLALHSLLQFLGHSPKVDNLDQIWNLLFDILNRFDVDEVVRNLISECIARFVSRQSDDSKYVNGMIKSLKDENYQVRACIVSTLRYYEAPDAVISSGLALLKDENIIVRKACLLSVTSLAKRQEEALIPFLVQILDNVYSETVVNVRFGCLLMIGKSYQSC